MDNISTQVIIDTILAVKAKQPTAELAGVCDQILEGLGDRAMEASDNLTRIATAAARLQVPAMVQAVQAAGSCAPVTARVLQRLPVEALAKLARAMQLEVDAVTMASLPAEKQAILNKKLTRVPDPQEARHD